MTTEAVVPDGAEVLELNEHVLWVAGKALKVTEASIAQERAVIEGSTSTPIAGSDGEFDAKAVALASLDGGIKDVQRVTVFADTGKPPSKQWIEEHLGSRHIEWIMDRAFPRRVQQAA